MGKKTSTLPNRPKPNYDQRLETLNLNLIWKNKGENENVSPRRPTTSSNHWESVICYEA